LENQAFLQLFLKNYLQQVVFVQQVVSHFLVLHLLLFVEQDIINVTRVRIYSSFFIVLFIKDPREDTNYNHHETEMEH
jgi:hypothetical protein